MRRSIRPKRAAPEYRRCRVDDSAALSGPAKAFGSLPPVFPAPCGFHVFLTQQKNSRILHLRIALLKPSRDGTIGARVRPIAGPLAAIGFRHRSRRDPCRRGRTAGLAGRQSIKPGEQSVGVPKSSDGETIPGTRTTTTAGSDGSSLRRRARPARARPDSSPGDVGGRRSPHAPVRRADDRLVRSRRHDRTRRLTGRDEAACPARGSARPGSSGDTDSRPAG